MPPGAANAPQGTALGNVKRQLAKLQDTCARMLVAERRRNASLEKHIAKLQAKVTKLEARDEELRAELRPARDERDAEQLEARKTLDELFNQWKRDEQIARAGP